MDWWVDARVAGGACGGADEHNTCRVVEGQQLGRCVIMKLTCLCMVGRLAFATQDAHQVESQGRSRRWLVRVNEVAVGGWPWCGRRQDVNRVRREILKSLRTFCSNSEAAWRGNDQLRIAHLNSVVSPRNG